MVLRGALLFAVLLVAAPVRAQAPVATVLGHAIARETVAVEPGPRAQARKLAELLWPHVARHYIGAQRLEATPSELAELAAYDAEFRRRDRAQRERKLAELHERLRSDALSDAERRFATEFRDVLERLARGDAEAGAAAAPDAGSRDAVPSRWIEAWKLNRAIHAQYGGVVALTRFGPDPHGARAALFADYERRGMIAIHDTGLRRALFDLLEEAPRMAVPPAEVDFTPYWQQPIPGSYYADEPAR